MQVKTTQPELYMVSPACCIVEPGEKLTIRIRSSADVHTPPEGHLRILMKSIRTNIREPQILRSAYWQDEGASSCEMQQFPMQHIPPSSISQTSLEADQSAGTTSERRIKRLEKCVAVITIVLGSALFPVWERYMWPREEPWFSWLF